MAEPCIQCAERPPWKPWSRYLCTECYSAVVEALRNCSCACHERHRYPASCCTPKHLIPCPEGVR